MKSNGNRVRVALMVMAALAAFSCNNEFTKSASPVDVIVTNTQVIEQIDLNGDGNSGNTNCSENIGTISVQVRLKNPDANVDQQFNDVRLSSYQVSYVRTDGGTHVPAPFTRSMDMLITTGGGASTLSKFIVFTSDALTQAPFVSLLPQNGGLDPETGRPVVRMDVIVTVFGATLAGTNVSGSTRFPLDFCFQCGGCE